MQNDTAYMESTFTALVMLGAYDDCRPSLAELFERCQAWLRRHAMPTVPLDAFARLLARISHPAAERSGVITVEVAA